MRVSITATTHPEKRWQQRAQGWRGDQTCQRKSTFKRMNTDFSAQYDAFYTFLCGVENPGWLLFCSRRRSNSLSHINSEFKVERGSFQRSPRSVRRMKQQSEQRRRLNDR
ncbi:hypothetical protein L210DRAFT_3180935 [Boletus edulis BED1]|uniref:Uncharacterized protein n=1 Tax=Boletus edulis BED1 TaxID=1328754 RepID=A0AAD4G875_BOLED|nr:hypothetical protein L210DRAFT_3180935 [Boletus edulis BED1]